MAEAVEELLFHLVDLGEGDARDVGPGFVGVCVAGAGERGNGGYMRTYSSRNLFASMSAVTARRYSLPRRPRMEGFVRLRVYM